MVGNRGFKLTTRVRSTYLRLKVAAGEGLELNMKTQNMAEMCYVSQIRDHLEILRYFGLINFEFGRAGCTKPACVKFTDKNIDDYFGKKAKIEKGAKKATTQSEKNYRILLTAIQESTSFETKDIYKKAESLGYTFAFSDLNRQLRILEAAGEVEIEQFEKRRKNITVLKKETVAY